jgi:hypothetical protein
MSAWRIQTHIAIVLANELSGFVGIINLRKIYSHGNYGVWKENCCIYGKGLEGYLIAERLVLDNNK